MVSPDSSDSDQRQRQLLEASYDWPAEYTFKFIVAAAQVAEVEALFPDGAAVEHRPSKEGKYVSITCRLEMESADAVLEVYARARRIEGIVGL